MESTLPFEKLHSSFVFFGGLEGRECAEIPPFAGFGIFLSGI
jgi:hypothetical protein